MNINLIEHHPLCLPGLFSQTRPVRHVDMDICVAGMLRYRHRYEHRCQRFVINILSCDYRAWEKPQSADNWVLFSLKAEIWELGLMIKGWVWVHQNQGLRT